MDQFMAWMVEKRTRRKHPTTAKLQGMFFLCINPNSAGIKNVACVRWGTDIAESEEV